MVSREYFDEWYVTGGKKYTGQLIINSKSESIILEIFGTDFIEGTEIAASSNHPQHFHQIIFGHITTATLYNCQWEGSFQIGHKLYRTTYRIEYVFFGIHFKNVSIPVRLGTFVFPHLSAWFDGEEFLLKLKGNRSLFVNDEQVIQNRLKIEEINVNDSLTIYIKDEVREQIEEINISYKVIYEKSVRFQYTENVPFSRLLKDAVTFLKMLSFCFGKPLNCLIVDVGAQRLELEKVSQFYSGLDDLIVVHVNNYTLKSGKPIETFGYHDRHMILSRWTCSRAEIEQVVKGWYANEKLYNIYEYYLDSNNWFQGSDSRLSNVMFNNRFLNLIQGLEDYFRENFETSLTVADREEFERKKREIMQPIKDPVLKQWFNNTFKFTGYNSLEDKLNKIIGALASDLEELFQNTSIEWFPKSASNFRNKLSHGMSKEINLGRLLHRDYFMAQVLLGVCILRSLGVTDLKNRVAYYSKFEDAANEIYLIQTQS